MKNITQKPQESKTVKQRLSRKTRDGQEVSQESSSEIVPAKATTSGSSLQLLPRVIRFKDAPGYLGMDRNRFNKEVRPGLVEFPIGTQGIGFDRLDLDAWFDSYKQRNGRPGPHQRGNEPWDVKKYQDSSKEANAGTLTNKSQAREFARALERATSKKPKGT